MRMSVFLIVFGCGICLATSSYSQTTVLTLNLQDKTVREVFSEIENNSEFIFFYYDGVLDLDRKVSVNMQNQTIDAILRALFANTNNSFTISDRQIVVSRTSSPPPPAPASAPQATVAESSQEIRITGRVVDAEGEPLPGASVYIRGSSVGVVTNSDGVYSIEIPNRSVALVFTFVGFASQEHEVGNRTVIDVQLDEDNEQFEELVVIGYGVQSRVTLTGAVSTIGSDELLSAPVPNVAHALAGNLSGLSAIQFSGQPGGDDPTIFIRGQGSLDSDRSRPLFLVDGVERDFFQLDPNEIESISILKDASATAVFGVRGANGVIMVTTKRGHAGRARISVSSSVGVQNPMRVLKYVDSYTWASMHNEARINDGVLPESVTFQQPLLDAFRTQSDPLLYPSTDWVDMFMKKSALQTQHNINVSGGTERVRYFTSVGVLTQDGIFNSYDDIYKANWTFNRYNYRANIDVDVTETTLLRVNLGGRTEVRHEPQARANNFWLQLQYGLPFAGVGLYEGKHVRAHQTNVMISDLENGDVFETIYGRGYVQSTSNTVNMDVTLTQRLDMLIPGLSFMAKGAYNNTFGHNITRNKSEPYYTAHRDPDTNELFFRKMRDGQPHLSFGQTYSRRRDWYLEGSLSYARRFGPHNVSALALYNQSLNQYPGGTFASVPRGYVGLVGRLTYDYNTKYLFDFNIGYNGSENFHRDHRYGVFPAFSVGWIISQESFLQGIDFLNYLKLRASYGIVGNDRYGGGRFYYLADAYNPLGARQYNFGLNTNQNQPHAHEERMGNETVTWEKARKQNYGLDFTALGSRLTGSFDYFIENRTDILIQRNTTPTHIAINVPVLNMGETENKGVEGALRWSQRSNDFRYNIGVNITFAKSKIVFIDEVPRDWDYLHRTGLPIDSHFGHIHEGFVTQADLDRGDLPDHRIDLRPGDVKYRDLNDDGEIDSDDMRSIGFSRWPQLSGGINMGFTYKNFDFTMMWAGASRVSRWMGEHYRMPFGVTADRSVMKYMAEEYWTPEREGTATTPRLSFLHRPNNYADSDLWLKDASYLRLKNAQIAYNFRGESLRRLGINNLRVSVSGQNLLTFDYIKIFDPEAAGGGYQYPLLRVFNFGVNVSF